MKVILAIVLAIFSTNAMEIDDSLLKNNLDRRDTAETQIAVSIYKYFMTDETQVKDYVSEVFPENIRQELGLEPQEALALFIMISANSCNSNYIDIHLLLTQKQLAHLIMLQDRQNPCNDLNKHALSIETILDHSGDWWYQFYTVKALQMNINHKGINYPVSTEMQFFRRIKSNEICGAAFCQFTK